MRQVNPLLLVLSALSRSLHRHPSASQGHLYTIQPNLGLPRTRPPLTSTINTLLVIRYSSILSKCSNHFNTSDLLYMPDRFLFQLSTHLSIQNSFHRNTPTKHCISRTFNFLLSVLLIAHATAPYNAVCSFAPSHRYFRIYPLIMYCLAHFQRSLRFYTHLSIW